MKRPLRGLRLLLFARCKHTSHAESDELDGRIAWDRWWAARLHRLVCKPCRHSHRRHRWFVRMLDAVPEMVRRREASVSQLTLSDEAKQRIRASLAEARDEDDAN
ncbi:MAG: hypothetical protein AAF266_04180 [Planctomycetota bacterium]